MSAAPNEILAAGLSRSGGTALDGPAKRIATTTAQPSNAGGTGVRPLGVTAGETAPVPEHPQRKLLEAAITALIHARRCTNFGGLLETRSGFNAVSALHDLLGDVNLGELVEEIGDVIAPPEGDVSNPYGLTVGERGRVL